MLTISKSLSSTPTVNILLKMGKQQFKQIQSLPTATNTTNGFGQYDHVLILYTNCQNSIQK